MAKVHFPSPTEAHDTPIGMEERPVSFAGNGALVLVVVAIIILSVAAGTAIYKVLETACASGCPQ